MDLRKKHDKLAADHRDVKYNFVLTELDLALTFCQISLTSEDKDKSLRNKENAERAHDSALHFLNDDRFSKVMKANVRKKLASLEALLRRLGSRRYDFAGT